MNYEHHFILEMLQIPKGLSVSFDLPNIKGAHLCTDTTLLVLVNLDSYS